jgi:hypothetical protein
LTWSATLEEFVDLLGDELLLLQAAIEDIGRGFEGRLGLRDGLQLDLGIAVHDVLVKLQRTGGLLAALVKHLARKAGIRRLLKPRGHGEVPIAGGHLVVNLFVEELGEFGGGLHEKGRGGDQTASLPACNMAGG